MLWTMCLKTFSFNMMRMRFFIQSLNFWRSITQSSVTTRSTIKNSWSLFALSRNDDQSLKILFILLRWSQIIKILSISCQLSSWVIIKLVEVSFCLNSTTVLRTKSSRALFNQITISPASIIEPSNSAEELQYLGWLFSSIWSMIFQSIFSISALRYN